MDETIKNDLDARLADLARTLAAQGTVAATAESITALAVDLVEGASDAGISLAHGRGRIETVAPTSETVAQADDLQHRLGEGPCVDALHVDEVDVPDLEQDDRWPDWRPRVVRAGVGSMLCVQLNVDDRGLGALNLYAASAHAFDDDDRVTARHLASHAAVALSSAHERATLQKALANRTVIGQAEGILMERFDVDADQAFSVLVRYSQHHNVKLATVAADLVRTRALPGVD